MYTAATFAGNVIIAAAATAALALHSRCATHCRCMTKCTLHRNAHSPRVCDAGIVDAAAAAAVASELLLLLLHCILAVRRAADV